MAFFLLPHSGQQSRMDIVRKDLFEVWEENGFSQINPLREALIRHFKVKTSPLAPTYRRLKGRFWEELSFWALPKKVQEEIQEKSLVPSPLFGLLKVEDLIPQYELDWNDEYEGEKLYSFWKRHLKELLESTLSGQVVFDLASTQDRKALTIPENAQVISFIYYRKEKRVINTLPHRAYTLRYIVEMKVDLDTLEKINFLDYKVREIREEGNALLVVMESEGKYI
ncbi:MAG: peroxide stress protein YaaA [Aquificae bacterium]|nr:peroxide stress protein YaaA [Aquificota bacterium]